MTLMEVDGERINVEASLHEINKELCEKSLVEFIKQAWHVIEPGQDYIHNWHIDAIAEHLTAITDGMMIDDKQAYNRLLINVPPGAMKSLLVSVLWPRSVFSVRILTRARIVDRDQIVRNGRHNCWPRRVG